MDNAKPAEIVPTDALASAVIRRNLSSHFLWYCNSFCYGIRPEKVDPVTESVGPWHHVAAASDSNTRRAVALGYIGLFYVPCVLVPSYLTIHDEIEARIRVLMNSFERVLEGAKRRRPSERIEIIRDVGRNVPLLHRVGDRLGVRVGVCDRVSTSNGAVGVQRHCTR